MKNLKTSLFVMTILTITFNACKKGDTGPQGPQGVQGPAGPSAKTYDFSLTYNQPQTSNTFYGIAIANYQSADAIIVYWENGGYWIQLPYIYATSTSTYDVSIWPKINPATGEVTILAHKYDEPNTWPWANSSITLSFRAVHIKGSYKIANPDLDYSDYEAVKKAYNLPN